jgi:release factor glutamine methyltransferase
MQRYLSYFEDKIGKLFPEREKKVLSRILLKSLAGMSSTMIYSDKDRVFSTETLHLLMEAIDRLSQHEPLQYIVGETDFCDITFKVKSGVLIPRPETEELLELISSDYAKQSKTDPHILDIGTGSGCIAITLAKKIKTAIIEAWDISEDALKIAQENAISNNVTIGFKQINVLEYIPTLKGQNSFDILVSNPPYVRWSEVALMERNVLDFEPHIALFVDDNDPLLFYRVIGGLATKLLKKGGHLYFEINSAFGDETKSLLESSGFTEVVCLKDISGKDRIIKAKL